MKRTATFARLCGTNWRWPAATSNVETRKQMRHLPQRPLSKLANRLVVPSALAIVLACGSSDEGASDAPEPPPSNGGTSGAAGAPPTMNGTTPSTMPSAEEIAALTDALGMAAGQVQAACGATFDRCGMTPGCNEILTCAARSACSGADCYCMDGACTMDGPCRSVIDSAPGARVPDASNPSLGPASDAARAVGDCLQGLGGGALPPGSTPAPLPTSPAGDGDGGAGDAG
jgi:hypothetical protein